MIYPHFYPASTRTEFPSSAFARVDCRAIIKATRDVARTVRRCREQVEGACAGFVPLSTRNSFSQTWHLLSHVTITLGNPCLSVWGRTSTAWYSWSWPRFWTTAKGPSIGPASWVAASIKISRIVTKEVPFEMGLWVDGWMAIAPSGYKPSTHRKSTEIGGKMFYPITYPGMHPSGTKNEGRKGAFESAPFPPKVVQVPLSLASTRKSTQKGSVFGLVESEWGMAMHNNPCRRARVKIQPERATAQPSRFSDRLVRPEPNRRPAGLKPGLRACLKREGMG